MDILGTKPNRNRLGLKEWKVGIGELKNWTEIMFYIRIWNLFSGVCKKFGDL